MNKNNDDLIKEIKIHNDVIRRDLTEIKDDLKTLNQNLDRLERLIDRLTQSRTQ